MTRIESTRLRRVRFSKKKNILQIHKIDQILIKVISMSTYVFLPDFWSHLKISSYVIVQILSFPFTPSFNPITHTPQIQVCLQTILSVPNIWFHITMHINCHRQRCNQLGHVWVTSTERIPR